jgi:hypothetical protein
MLKTLAALALGVAVLSASGCCWPYHGGRHGGYGHGDYDDRSGGERPDPPRSARGRPAPPSWSH